MYAKPQDVIKASVDFSAFVINTYLNGFERLAALNLAASRSVFETALANASALLGAKDVQSLLSVHQSLAKPSLEKGIDYSRSVYAITNETKAELTKAVESHVAETNAKVTGLVEKALAAAPAGSEVAVAAVKSVISAANDAYEGLNKAAKQVAEVAEANLTAATQATLKAATEAAPKGKKVA